MNKVVLAYSGGLDTSVAVAWLREQHGAEVVTLTVDLGGGSIREGLERRAVKAGASKAYVVDARETFVQQYAWRALQANAIYQGAYPLATALARPLLAQLLVEVARKEGADAVARALANDPPSGTFYDPDHATPTKRLPSLGVHEHWNDPQERKYSRNLGTGEGIELVSVKLGSGPRK